MYQRPEYGLRSLHHNSIDTITSGMMYPAVGAGAGAYTGTAQSAQYYPVQVHHPVTVYALWVGTNATAGTGTYDIGLYDAAGTRLEALGSTSRAAVTEEAVYTLATPRKLRPGRYYLGFVSSNTTDQWQTVAFAAPYLASIGVREEALGSTTLPATATLTGFSTAGVAVAVGMFLNTVAA